MQVYLSQENDHDDMISLHALWASLHTEMGCLPPPWALVIHHAEAIEKPDLDFAYNLTVPFHALLFI